ncbi:CidA/LrgA family protein [Peptoniphilus stercorisuis]|uniref:Effector of murein hydrolase LrgA (UPF0299 family) n=1 Tax=Peptoniphilus stercorisuis TaxID=1436965 RepID=A0ABS4K9X9_9FIRM|nr:CidA/LrgA family protein [Peptoniphilus stercorisuis]MBP2024548.1 putative effector of murein hydrolase LrgA (UPF0299 family) [Peptoniphilus stercorisuis]
MHTLYQFGVYIGVLFAGLVLREIIPATIPAPVYGMILLFLLLSFKIVKADSIKPVTTRLLDIMPFLFVPTGVAMINEMDNVKGKVLLILLMLFITTFIVLFVTGHVVQIVQRALEKREVLEEVLDE